MYLSSVCMESWDSCAIGIQIPLLLCLLSNSVTVLGYALDDVSEMWS